MKVSVGQIAVKQEWLENAQSCLSAIETAKNDNADLLVLPEAILARNIGDPNAVLRSAQPLDGPFMQMILAASAGHAMTIIFTIHTPAGEGRVHNTLVVVRGGKVIAEYRKLHLYDAFSMQESKNVTPGEDVPPLVEVAGLKLGLMTCYDIRFPELARRLADDGADAFVLPAAWVKGPLKEHHWETLVTARALENTSYIVACGECGERSIGMSMVVDPLGVVIARTGEAPAQFSAILDKERIAQARRALPALANRRFARPELASGFTGLKAAE